MIQVVKLNKSYGHHVLFSDVSFSLGKNERIGLVGRNGHGKTTLLRIIAGTETADEGQIIVPQCYRIGYLTQHLNFTKSTVLEEASLGIDVSDETWGNTYNVESILLGLGFSVEEFSKDPRSFSGGFQLRLNLAKLLASKPDLLLLDEPTNYLDILSVRWLVRFLQNWRGEIMLVTHEQEFMNQVSTHIMGIHRAKVRKVKGDTAKYYEQLFKDEEIYEQTRLNQTKKREQTEAFVERFRAKASKARQVQSRLKVLEKTATTAKLEDIKSLEFQFTWTEFPGKWPMELRDVSFSYDRNSPPLFSGVSLSVGKRDRIAVIGRNGKGKTTLLRLLAKELEPTAGEITHSDNLKLGYFGQTNVNRLDLEKTVEEEIVSVVPNSNRGLARSLCAAMMFEGDAALKKIRVLSGGERSRVLIGKILATPCNCLVLDEPTNHLDLESTNSLCTALERFNGAVIMVTHSEMLLHRLASRLVVFDNGDAFVFEGRYVDFLKRIGWRDEQTNANGETEAVSSKSKKLLRQQKAEITTRRNQVLVPLRNEIGKIEKEISELEKNEKELLELILQNSQNNNGNKIGELSKNLKNCRDRCQRLYDKLDSKTQELDGLVKKFENELQTLGAK